MFTGLVEDVGEVVEIVPVPKGMRLKIATRFDDLAHGASVAVDGVCLTAVELPFAADVSAETLSRTTLGDLRVGHKVNLERPVRLQDRLGGHLVLGHVDGVGEIVSKENVGEGVRVRLKLPAGLAQYVVEKGSIALDGISLTVNGVFPGDQLELFLIPETLRATTWGIKVAGARVNVEADILAKHVERLLQFRK